VNGRSVALPIRITADGQLERTDAVEALAAVLHIMAASSARTWPHAPWFGMQEMIAARRGEIQQPARLAEAFNTGLAGLGVDWARVETVRPVRQAGSSEVAFEVALRIDGHGVVHRELEV
jgi:hypothetical protein